MSFTYLGDLTTNRDYVRFHCGDVVADESLLSDELIASLITSEGSKQRAVIAAIDHKIARLSDPNFEADWLKVDNRAAVQSLEKLRANKAASLGISLSGLTFVSGVTHTYRADSEQTSEPDYSQGV